MSSSGSDEETKYYPLLELDFIIQVNGKLATYTQNFRLEESEFDKWELSLKNWNEWYIIRELFDSLGYCLSEDPEDKRSDYANIRKWIHLIYPNWMKSIGTID